MSSAQNGFERAICEGFTGIATYAILSHFLTASGHVYAIFLLNIISICSIVFLYDKMTYWSLTYTVGWLSGLFIFGSYLFEWWELIIYVVVTFVALRVKIENRF